MTATRPIPAATPWIQMHGSLCENPLWDAARSRVLWTDIEAGTIWEAGLDSKAGKKIYSGPSVGGFTIQTNGDLLLFRERDIIALAPDGSLGNRMEFLHEGSTRFNDVSAIPSGCVLAGTIGHTKNSGGLFLVDRNGCITQIASGTGCSNGIGFSPDQATLYWTCTTRRTIFAFDYDADANSIGNQRPHIPPSVESDGLPDGLAVDSEGNLWSARWGAEAHSLIVYSPTGVELSRSEKLAHHTTSLCFAGPELDQLVITSAKGSDPRPADLFLIPSSGFRGQPEFLSSVVPSR